MKKEVQAIIYTLHSSRNQPGTQQTQRIANNINNNNDNNNGIT